MAHRAFHFGVVEGWFFFSRSFQPHWRRTAMTPVTKLAFRSSAGDLAHGVVEAHPEDLREEVDGVAGLVAFGPAPVAVFDDESGMGGQNKVARLVFDEGETAPLEQRNERGDSGGADLFAGPARPWVARRVRGGCHSLFSSGVG